MSSTLPGTIALTAAVLLISIGSTAAQPRVSDTVICEPQGSGNPTHPSTYWYDVTPTAFGRCDFHVQVFDPEPNHYTNPSLPFPTWQFQVHQVGEEWWASWWDPGCLNAIFGTTRFQFDNSRPATWSRWATTIDGSSDPYAQVVDSSSTHTGQANGYGYHVHAPIPPGIRFYVDENNDGGYDPGEEVPSGGPVLYLKKNSSSAVFVNTGLGGRIAYSGASKDDQVYSRHLAYAHPAIKGQRGYAGSMVDLYMDTDSVSGTGFISARRLTTTEAATINAGGIVNVALNHPIFSWNLLVGLNWNASTSYLDKLKDGFRAASNYMFDVTDGHAKLGRIDIQDNLNSTSADWKQADIRVSSSVWPAMIGGVGVLNATGAAYVRLPRYFDGSSTSSGDPDKADYFRTIVHELGHYLFDFYDEYQDGSGSSFRTYRNSNRDEVPSNCGLMDSQLSSSEMSSFNDYRLPSFYTGKAASTMSRQVWNYRVRSGGSIEPCWDHFHKRFDNSGGLQTLWTGFGGIRAVVSAPPAGVYLAVNIAGFWFEFHIPGDRPGPSNYYPNNFGDFVNVLAPCYFSSKASEQRGDSPAEEQPGEDVAGPAQAGPGLLLDARLEVIWDEYLLDLTIVADEDLWPPPEVVVEPEHTGGLFVTMTMVEPRVWEGSVNIGPATEGVVNVTGSGTSGVTVVNGEFSIQEHAADYPTIIRGAAGWFEANLPAGVPGGNQTAVTIDSGQSPIPLPGGLPVILSQPVSFHLEQGTPVGAVYTLNWRLAPETLDDHDATTLGLYRFDDVGLVWQSVPATFTPGYRLISAGNAVEGIYAVVAQPSPDSLPPAGITDLTAATGNDGQGVHLSWTAPGDDGATGQAIRYHIHFDTEPITLLTLEQSREHAASIEPLAAGETESHVLEMPEADVRYYFVVRARDEAENLGPLSNVVSAVSHVIDEDLDGLPNDWELAFDFNPSVPGDELLDPDLDGLTNLEEYQNGTLPHDPDTDSDGAADGSDCAPLVGTAFAVVEDVAGVELAILDDLGTAEIDWIEPGAGSGTRYDLVSGFLSELRDDEGFAQAICLVSELTGSPFVDPRPSPDVDQGYYYLVRGGNACGVGTYGSSGETPDPRVVLNEESPCP